MPSLNQIRQTFLDYFAKNDHEIVSSSSLVPHNDPTLMFTNAGMVQFKNVFTGAETRPYKRATTSQKVVRAGGKHNDLDNVGYTARHHTFFEMLGNFSFGDYFKEQAISHAWNLITKEYGLPKDRLLATVYIDDDEAFNLWKKIAGFSDDRIIRIAGSDNFWSMGDTGPCGPCTEIFYDHGEHIWGGPPGSPEEDGDRFVEIWNLVFMQFDQQTDGTRLNLPKPSIDTGMGLERVAAVLQGVHNNYDVDLFKALIRASVEETGVKAEGEALPSHRVIADHLRSTSFLIADGVTPSNEGRGYVLRRIMRRAMRHAYLLGANEPLMPRLAPVLVREMGDHYGELKRAEATIIETLRQEEERFRRTLGRGMTLLDEATANLKDGDMLEGEVAFKLYDTYGFPLDLTQDAIRAKGLSVNVAGFEAAMGEQKQRGRANWKGSGETSVQAEWFSIRDQAGASEFVGYEHLSTQSHARVIVRDGESVSEGLVGERLQVVFDRTVFYPEGGGQAGDTGTLHWAGGEGRVLDTQKQAGDLIVHDVEITEGVLAVGDMVHLHVDGAKRQTTKSNHSAAHLLHAALKNVLGPHVAQKGQLVDAERMRFDFSHGAPVSPEEIERIEAEVNAVILQNEAATTKMMAPAEAIEAGAVALFGEKYGDEVRVLSLGHALDGADKGYSVELCGGTHVSRTGDIALFKIISESGIAAGVRRIEAFTGEAARQYLLEQAGVARSLADQFKVPVAQVSARVEALVNDRKRLEKELADAKRALAVGGGGKASGPEDINGVKVIARVLDGVGGKDLRPLAEDFKKQVGSGVVALVGVLDGKAAVTVAVTPDLTGRFNAAELAKAAVIAMGGQGAGGKPDFAQGGAPDATKAEGGLDAIKAAIV
ncbi:alanine--tRNA ligase [Asticcacaulis excentricus]|uniref:Alanine--tRNA ligase n=1 Tax=Asticcacaulis excentricus (strain ATCC 15261 / DSM 4724 / KCTC 12464 / NCIMB 9791 / VKM B-1370 / CB 48) TaxID=573065 RepID=E8RUV4_ASTEC|nr:alanine--tRNA ligase [Asticcacaulis excentricus]ADU14154.1 alanyl-tRNA synthetase [Asticcacaulis excentricus CB 48]